MGTSFKSQDCNQDVFCAFQFAMED
ncbi:unnamed protein product [Rhodiola kirilowii]